MMKYCMLKPITHGSEGLTFDIVFSVNMGVRPAAEPEVYISSGHTRIKYMMKYCSIMFMMHGIAGEIGGVSEMAVGTAV